MARAIGRTATLGCLCALWLGLLVVGARAQESCSHVVVLALPGVTWRDIQRVEPPAITNAVENGASGSMSVRTNSSRTSLASGFVTIGAGARVDGGLTTGGPAETAADGLVTADVAVGGFGEVRARADDQGYGARPGALAQALDVPVFAVGNGDLGKPVPAPFGYGRWSLLAAMDATGVVDRAATDDQLLVADPSAPYAVVTDEEVLEGALDVALAPRCSVVIVEQGDLTRADQFSTAQLESPTQQRDEALMKSDELLAELASRLDLDRDLLLVVSPTSPAYKEEAHLGIAVAMGPGFDPGATLESASTRRAGIVTLPDVAPTILEHLGVGRPAAMNGRAFFAAPAKGDPFEGGVNLDREATFIDEVKGPVNAVFVAFQVIVYALILILLAWRERRGGVGATAQRWLETAGLAVVAFPVASFLAGVVRGHELGVVLFALLLVAIDAALVAAATLALRDPLDRLLALSAFTLAVLAADLMTGSRLQLNTVFGYSPIVAGRFAGAGNIVFAVLGAVTIVTGALVAYRWRGARRALIYVGLLFGAVIVVDGAPQFGSDVGGILALVPALGLTWLLLSGRRPSVSLLLLAGLAAVAVLGIFLVIDLSRPAGSQTHLARLWLDVVERGPETLWDTLVRKAEANVRVFTSTIYTFFIPPALLVLGYLLRRPSGRWQRLAASYPRLRAGLVGGLVLAVLGFAVNDSGVVIPAVVLSFLVPMALLVHLAMEREVIEQ